MNSDSNYPLMSQSEWNSAPWNQSDIPEREFELTISQTLSKTVTVFTDDYVPGASGVDYEPDGEGGYCSVGYQDPDDTSDTHWSEVYHENDYHTPEQLIGLFKRYLEAELGGKQDIPKSPSYLKHLIKECEDWCEDDIEYVGE